MRLWPVQKVPASTLHEVARKAPHSPLEGSCPPSREHRACGRADTAPLAGDRATQPGHHPGPAQPVTGDPSPSWASSRPCPFAVGPGAVGREAENRLGAAKPDGAEVSFEVLEQWQDVVGCWFATYVPHNGMRVKNCRRHRAINRQPVFTPVAPSPCPARGRRTLPKARDMPCIRQNSRSPTAAVR